MDIDLGEGIALYIIWGQNWENVSGEGGASRVVCGYLFLDAPTLFGEIGPTREEFPFAVVDPCVFLLVARVVQGYAEKL